MKRRLVLAGALALLDLPLAVAATGAVAFHRANRGNGAIVSSGVKRDYVLYVPRTYDRSRPAPLVISMHGAALWGAAQRDISGWNRVAEREGFIVVYPSGEGGGTERTWGVERGEKLGRDVRFIGDLIDTIAASYHIDRARVYADGLSNGGGMAFVLSCTMPTRIAAVGLVSSAQTLPWDWCTDRHPVPMIAIHGTADSVVPYRGGRTWVSPRPFPSMVQWTENWARRNRCAAATDSAIAADVVRRTYSGCAADVVLYTVNGGGHTWPGSSDVLPEWFVGRTTHNIDAAETLWAFFKARFALTSARGPN